MNTISRTGKITLIFMLMISLTNIIIAKEKVKPENQNDSSTIYKPRFLHKIGVEFSPNVVLPKVTFVDGETEIAKPVRKSFAGHLKYSFQSLSDFHDRIYGSPYQGIGLGYNSFGDSERLGDPLSVYLFQGGRIAHLDPRVTLNYEWNFGLSFNWKPYHVDDNYSNKVIGSKVNAYLNTNFYFNIMLSEYLDFVSGITFSHFSNGNTKFPNAGLNTIGLKFGLIYTMNGNVRKLPTNIYQPAVPYFQKHVSYDLVLFGSWRRKAVKFADTQVASPDAYAVFGFNFAPMYNFGYKFRAGLSLDGVYDSSANVYTEDYIVGTEQPFYKPSIGNQLALGVSARAEYVMPYFTIGIGMGTNVVHGGGDLKGFYQILALKIEMTRNSFLHIGYNLKDFHDPNYLMLGIGYRFNNKYPKVHR